MKIVTHVLAAIIAATLILVPVARKLPNVKKDSAVFELLHTKQIVEKELADVAQSVYARLNALGATISEDRDFSMNVLVEQNLMASEVTGIGQLYMGAMGLSVLEITDAKGTILSSGHFAARAGGVVFEKLESLGNDPQFIVDNLKGSETLTYQCRAEFTCVDQQFYCMGGLVVNERFLDLLTPRKGVQVLLKQGSDVLGMEGIETMSEVEDNSIIINDVTYLAASIKLPAVSAVESPQLIILMDEPEKTSLLDLL